MEMSKQKENKWLAYSRILLSTASHPFEYAKVLMQIGYEPIPPRPSTTLFGKPALKLPNIFQYVKYIKSQDGFLGCYKGFAPKTCGMILSVIAVQNLSHYMKFEEEAAENVEEEGQPVQPVDNKTKFMKRVKQDLITNITAIVISHPFHVITVRIMAQFVGKEKKYDGLIGSVVEIYNQNGVLGFFAGFVPRLLGDIISVILANSLTYLFMCYVSEKELQLYASATTSLLATAITYPFQVVSKCMIVNESGLMAGAPSMMPLYKSWIDCWADLSRQNQLKRGSSVLVRYYSGPQIIVGGRVLPTKDQLLH